MVANAFCKSIRIIPVKGSFSNLVVILSGETSVSGIVLSKTRIIMINLYSIIFDNMRSIEMGW